MPYSYVKYTADGINDLFTVTFPYINQLYIAVYANDVAVGFTWQDATTIKTNGIPAAGTIIEIKRTTNRASRLVDFQNASKLTEADLDLSADQQFHVMQEVIDNLDTALRIPAGSLNYNANNRRIVNLATPVDDNDAVNKSYLDGLYLDECEAARDAAVAAKVAAETAETNAEAAEANALTYRNQADGYADDAGSYAIAAYNYSEKAELWAEHGEDQEVETGKYSAKHWAAKAEDFYNTRHISTSDPSGGSDGDVWYKYTA